MAEQSALDLGVAKEPKPAKLPHDLIAETAGALFDPISVFPDPGGGWEDSIPENLKKELPLHRLAHNMCCLNGKASWDEACDLEALLYLYPASLVAPMPEHWENIYFHLGAKVAGSRMPSDIAQKTLDYYEMGMLRDLKRWIYQQKVKHRKKRARAGKAELKPEPAKYKQLSLP